MRAFLPVEAYEAGGTPTIAGRAIGVLLLACVSVTVSCTEVRVSAVDVARVQIEPGSLSLMVGESAGMNAKLLDAVGRELRGRTVSWSSATPAVAAIDATGRVYALTPGSTTIAATSEGARAEIAIVVAARPALVVDPVDVTMTALAGGLSPPAVSVLVRANGTATGLSLSTRYANGQPTGWLVASLTGTTTPAILTINISNAGLVAGTYDATIGVNAEGAESERVIPVTLIIQQQQPDIGLSAAAAAFGPAPGGRDPPAQTIAVTNAGGGSLDGLRIAVAYAPGQPGGWLNAELTGTDAPATLTLEPSTATLAAGSYAATVLVSSAAATNSPRTIDVTLEVEPPLPVIEIWPPGVVMSGTAGGVDPAPVTAGILNGGGGQLTGLHATVTHAPGEPSGWLAVNLSSTDAPATLTLIASTSTLAAGSYSAFIEIAAADPSIPPSTLTVTLNANAPIMIPGIGASPQTVTLSAIEGGVNPAAAVIDVVNTGGGTLDRLAVAITYDAGQPTGWLNAALGGPTAPTNITAQATTGTLVAGAYGATIEVSSPAAGNSPLAIDVEFLVTGPPAIAVSATSLAFSDVAGGPNPQAQAIDVTNGGAGTLDGLAVSVAYGSSQPTGWLSTSIGSPTAPTKIDVQPVTGQLPPGTYDATLSVTSAVASNSPVSIDVMFTVDTPPAIGLSGGSLTFQGVTGGANPQSQDVSITNSGGGTLDGLATTVRYAAGQPAGWLNLVLSGSAAPATLTVQPDLGSLVAGTYDASIDVTSAVAANSPQTIDVSFTLVTVLLPAAPVLLTAEEHKHHADLTWQDNSSNETSFIVQRSLQATSGWSGIATLQANDTDYRDNTGTRGVLYYYRIAACNLAGCAISNVLSVVM